MFAADRLRLSTDRIAALLAGLAAVSGSYAFAGPTPSFVASPVERAVSRTLPIELVVFAISVLDDLGQQLNLAFAASLVVVIVALVARTGQVAAGATGTPVVGPLLTTVATWGLAVGLTGDFAVGLGAAVPAGLVVLGARAAHRFTDRDRPLSSKRRRAMATLGAAAGIASTGYLAGERLTPAATGEAAPDLSGENVDRSTVEAGLAGARARELDVPAVGPLVSDRFYEVDVNAVDPAVDAEDWELSVTGAVDESFAVSYDDVRAMPVEHRFVTLRCVGDPLNGRKMDDALWTGVPVRHLLDRADPSSDCGCVKLHAADGYFQVFPLDALAPGLLAYGMNGKILPRGHGYPLRTLVPGHWGEVNVKWLTEIEFLNEDAQGYWEKRGWHGTGPVTPVAKLHTSVDRDDGTRLVGGRAYAGTPGVSRVAVSTDGGETWADARLSDPLSEVQVPGDATVDATDVWRQWAYEYDPPDGSHTVVVRVVDGNGDVQPEREADPYPRGASGWVSREY